MQELYDEFFMAVGHASLGAPLHEETLEESATGGIGVEESMDDDEAVLALIEIFCETFCLGVLMMPMLAQCGLFTSCEW